MSTPPVNYAANSEPSGFEFNEKYLSQIPALQQLINLGYQYLTPEQALAERGGRSANVILEGVLRHQLKKINRINYKGGEYLFSEENIQTAIQKLKNIKFDGLQKTNESIYDLITLGSAMEQTIEGTQRALPSITLIGALCLQGQLRTTAFMWWRSSRLSAHVAPIPCAPILYCLSMAFPLA